MARSARSANKLQLPFEGPGAEAANAYALENGDWLMPSGGDGDGAGDGDGVGKLLDACLDVRPRVGQGVVKGRLLLGECLRAWTMRGQACSAAACCHAQH